MTKVEYVVTLRNMTDGNKTYRAKPSQETEDVKGKMESKKPVRTHDIAEKQVSREAIAGILTAYNFGTRFMDLSVRQQSNQYVLNGDFITAKRTQNQYAVGQEIVNNSLALGSGLAIAGGLGLTTVGVNLAINYAFKALNVGLENRRLIEQSRVQQYIGNIENDRFVNNLTTRRIR